MRGLFTSGVLDVMLEQGVSFDAAIGVSAGAAFGCNFKSKQNGRAIRYCKKYAKEPKFCSFRSYLKTGDFFGGEFCYHTLPEKLDVFDNQAYNDNPMTFTVVCTDVLSGKAVYQECNTVNHDTYEWFRASASMPLAAKIVTVGGKQLLDGGVADSIPLPYFEQQGFWQNIVILTQPSDYRKEPNRMLPVMKLKYRKYPAFIEAVRNRHIIYNQELDYVAEAEKAGRAFVIRPSSKLPIGHLTHDADLMQEVYELGRKAAKDAIPNLLQFLSQP